MDEQQWLQERRKGIGGSDAAAVMGLSRYNTPYTVWADKLGMLPPKDDNEAMRQGRDFENYVAKRFCEVTNKKVQRVNTILTNKKYPFAIANIDRKVIGEKAGLECKTATPYKKDEYKEEGYFPTEYYIQCLHYLAVTGYDKWYLAVLIYGTEFKWYCIEPNEDITELMRSEQYFWNEYVLKRQPPPMDGLEPTNRALSSIYNTSVQNSINLSENRFEDFIEIEQLQKQINELKQKQDQCKQRIKHDMGNNEKAICGNYIVNWKCDKRGSRRFMIKEII